jgi:hypothetical protein
MLPFRARLALAVALIAVGPASAQPRADDPTAVLTETLILVTGHQLNQTHQYIVVLAEVRIWAGFEASTLALMLGSATEPLEAIDRQLGKVAGLKLTKAEAATVARLRKVAGLLRQEGKSLQTYWDTGVEDHWKTYQDVRKQAWKELDDLLDLEPKKGIAPAPRQPGAKKP